MNKNISIEKAFQDGWGVFKSHVGIYVGIVSALFLLSFFQNGLQAILKAAFEENMAFFIANAMLNFAFFLISAIVTLYFIKISLDFIRGLELNLTNIDMQQVINYVAATFLYNFMLIVGIFLFVVPGIIVLIAFQFYGYFIIEEKLGAIEALKKSYYLTLGVKWQLFTFLLFEILVIVAGALLCLVGLFAALPIIMIATASVYLQLKGVPKPQITSAEHNI